ncbi:MAG: HAD-IC family P-type ATPase [Bacilli bacterium]|nr:HAD-IC family P-type ATPase [Bacilli bacterium]
MKDKCICRYYPKTNFGLSDAEVQNRKQNNLVNFATNIKSKSFTYIIISNVFTLFNFLNFMLALAIIYVGSYKNLLFLGVVFCNTIISIIQEINAKIIVDRLSVISEIKVKVIRNGQQEFIKINDIVLDDIIIYQNGNQIVTDSIIAQGSVEVDESFITGESDPIYKKAGDLLKSGSFIISGKCYGRVEHVGLDNYTAQITKGAKYVKKIDSVLLKSLKKIIKVISLIIIPIGILLFYQQLTLDDNILENAVINTVAALIGMIPEGLVLLTSTVLAVSVIRLARQKVLVQDLYSIESLARTDVICFDKTGTLTTGKMKLFKVINFVKNENSEVIAEVINGLDDNSPTISAIKKHYNCQNTWQVKGAIPFSSSRKWSGVSFKNRDAYLIGAPERLLLDKKLYESYMDNYRLLALVKTNSLTENLNNDLEPIALFLIEDEIRSDAITTLDYFQKENVDVKIISGDSVRTISGVAKKLGFKNYLNYIDVSNMPDEILIKASLKYDIFGRVSPKQKKVIIDTLRENGHYVAMIGDGVNDVLALKSSSVSVALASGSDAARNIAEIVLLDSDFDAMPNVVKEGRRTINNITRSATLFLAKTSYATMLALLFLFIEMSYPFEPIQLTLISATTIGIPSFILAIEPNNEKIRGNFIANVISRSLPAAFTTISNILIVMLISYLLNWTDRQISTFTLILTGYTGFLLLYKLSEPFNLIRKVLFIFLVSMFVLAVLNFRNLFSITTLNLPMLIYLLILIISATFFFAIYTNIYYKVKIYRHKRKSMLQD